MTPRATNDRKVLCRVQLTGEGRWVSLTLSLSDFASATRFLVEADVLRYEMAGVDEAARTHGLSNWQGGVISGARYAFRALKAPIRQVCLHELRGQLGSADVWALSSAAALAVARLLDRPPAFPLDLGGWAVEEEIRSFQGGDGLSQSAQATLRQPQLPRDRTESDSASSGKTDPNHAAEHAPLEPGAASEPPRQ